VPLLKITKLFALTVPTFLEMTLAMALLLGIFLGLGRLSNDSEILALKASGVSPAQILAPIALLAAVASLLILVITTWVRPHALLALKRELYDIARSRVTTALKAQIFNDDFPGILLYADEVVPPGETIQGVMLIDRRSPTKETLILAKVALVVSDERSQSLNVKLVDGTAYERAKGRAKFSQTRFDLYEFTLNLDEAFNLIRKKNREPKEMSLRRLVETIRLKESRGSSATAETIELHLRFSFVIAPMIFSLLGIALVLIPGRSPTNRSWGVALCSMCLLLYYVCLSLGRALAEREWLPPFLGPWLPNAVLGWLAFYLFRKALRESPLQAQRRAEDFVVRMRQRWVGQNPARLP
jgi:lipopolysaccharide export system permease protein